MYVAILGAGESGRGAAILAAKLKYAVLVSDSGEISGEARQELELYNVPFEESGHTFEKLVQADFIVKSPGIPQTANVVRELRKAQQTIVSEIEFAFRHCPGKVIAVTGSNGKTTTTMLIHHVLIENGIDAALCGNVGTSFARTVASGVHDWYVAEVSSFQLEDVEMFQPEIAVLLNITPDHLDRYGGDIQRYAETKWRIAGRMTADQLFIFDKQSAETYGLLKKCPLEAQTEAVGEMEATRLSGCPPVLSGTHDQYNAVFAFKVCERAGLSGNEIRKAMQSFEKPPHRMQKVAEVNGVLYVNDSKATNTDSVKMALRSTKAPIVWIAGGEDKGNDYSALHEMVREKVRVLICLGIDNEQMKEAFSSEVDEIQETTSMREAVSLAASSAMPGDTILLSPACASFDLFNNYIDRGLQFIEAVNRLKSETEE